MTKKTGSGVVKNIVDMNTKNNLALGALNVAKDAVNNESDNRTKKIQSRSYEKFTNTRSS